MKSVLARFFARNTVPAPAPAPVQTCRKHLFGVGAGEGPCPICGAIVIAKPPNGETLESDIERDRRTSAVKVNESQDIGHAKYVVNYCRIGKTHPDGSDFYDARIFSNRKLKDAFVKRLKLTCAACADPAGGRYIADCTAEVPGVVDCRGVTVTEA